MRVVFDTCVLVPSFLREVLLACVLVENVDYIVSSRILTEWSRASKTPLHRLEADVAITRRLKEALDTIDVRVLDHLIIGHSQVVSLAERGQI